MMFCFSYWPNDVKVGLEFDQKNIRVSEGSFAMTQKKQRRVVSFSITNRYHSILPCD